MYNPKRQLILTVGTVLDIITAIPTLIRIIILVITVINHYNRGGRCVYCEKRSFILLIIISIRRLIPLGVFLMAERTA